MEAYLRPKRLGISGRHAITGIWESLAPKVGAVLDVGQVNWNSIDPVRIGYVDELSAPLVLWIGIRPDSQVPYEVNYSVAAKCKALLVPTTSRMLKSRCGNPGSSNWMALSRNFSSLPTTTTPLSWPVGHSLAPLVPQYALNLRLGPKEQPGSSSVNAAMTTRFTSLPLATSSFPDLKENPTTTNTTSLSSTASDLLTS